MGEENLQFAICDLRFALRGAFGHFLAALAGQGTELVGAEGGGLLDLDDHAAAEAGEAVAFFGGFGGRLFQRGVVGFGDFFALVHGEVGELVGEGVFVAEVVLEFGFLELMEEVIGLFVERFELGVADAVLAEHLFDDQFAVASDEKFFGAHFLRFLQACDEGLVFGDVVGGAADEAAEGEDGGAVGGAEDDADAGGAGIAAAAAVEFDGYQLVHGKIIGDLMI